MLRYDTLLDLAQQRLGAIAESPNKTREARTKALALRREVKLELYRVMADRLATCAIAELRETP